MEPEIIKDNKIAFIICVNNQMYLDECCAYIERLPVPQGYEVEVFPVWDSSGMCQAYNVGMNASDAKYKVYIHQDVFIVEQNFLYNIVDIFKKHKDVGMIGMVGAESIPKTGVFFNSYNVGKIEVREPDMPYYYVAGKDKKEIMDVQAVDGVLIATQIDITWREDLFKDFDFYDVSQGLEFIRAGYRVVVPAQEKPWIIHDCGFAKLNKYDKNRLIFVKNYSGFLTSDGGTEFEYNEEWDKLSSQLAEIVKNYIDAEEWYKVEELLDVYKSNNYKNSELEKQCIIYDIYKTEMKENGGSSFCKAGMSYKQIAEKYSKIRFAMRRYELGMVDDVTENYEKDIMQGEISVASVLTMLPHTTIRVKDFIMRLLLNKKNLKNEFEQLLSKVVDYAQKTDANIAYGRKYC